MKIDVITATRFGAPIPLNALEEVGHDLSIISSLTANRWGLRSSSYRFTPHWSALLGKIFGSSPSRRFKDNSTASFGSRAEKKIRPDADVIYGWATFSAESFLRRKNAYKVLERACPHIEYQQTLLGEEAEMLGVPYPLSSVAYTERCLTEYELSDYIIVPSQYTYRSFVDYGVPASKLKVIELDSSFTLPVDYKVRERLADEPFVVGTVAGTVLRKGLFYLVEAWLRLDIKNGLLKIKTPISELEKHPLLFKKIRNCETIEVVGFQKNMVDFYRTLDLFVLPSIDEGFGMVVCEASACGVPVVCTQNVGASSFINEHTGDVIPIKDTERLMDCLNKYHASPQHNNQVKASAHAHYKIRQRSQVSSGEKYVKFFGELGGDHAVKLAQ